MHACACTSCMQLALSRYAYAYVFAIVRAHFSLACLRMQALYS